jgi:predicted tellurium resistance membrane protein TerC
MTEPLLAGMLVFLAGVIATLAIDNAYNRLERLLCGITVIGLLATAAVMWIGVGYTLTMTVTIGATIIGILSVVVLVGVRYKRGTNLIDSVE